MFIVLFFLSAHILTPVLASSVSVLFPLDSQLPPIARVGFLYSWKFAEGRRSAARHNTTIETHFITFVSIETSFPLPYDFPLRCARERADLAAPNTDISPLHAVARAATLWKVELETS